MELFHDRRDFKHIPKAEDYEKPLDKQSLAEANNRFRQTGVPGVIIGINRDRADKIIKHTAQERSRAKKKGKEDFATVGEYLEYLNGKGYND